MNKAALTTSEIWTLSARQLGTCGNQITFQIYWGSEIQTSLEFKWSKKFGYVWPRFQIGSEIWNPNHMKSGQITAILS